MQNYLPILLGLIWISPSCLSQTTFVPDDHFEQNLIDLGYDDVLDDFVQTESIDTISELFITWKKIEDLTGIEDFQALNFLNVGFNNLTTLDVSQNQNLEHLFCEVNELSELNLGENNIFKTLYCRGNALTQLDLTGLPMLDALSADSNSLINLDTSQNPVLRHFSVYNNQLSTLNLNSNPVIRECFIGQNPLTTIDLSQNPLIYNLYLTGTLLEILDLTQNPELIFFECSESLNLVSLDFKNQNNQGILTFRALNNPNLFCIEVDDPDYSQQNWLNVDPWMNFNEECILGLDEIENEKLEVFPNPVVDKVYFSSGLSQISLFDLTGKKLLEHLNLTQEMNLSQLDKGIYVLKALDQKGNIVYKKISIK